MGLFGERFPYSNTHDLNLDWIIDTVKKLADKYDNFESDIASKVNKPDNNPDGVPGQVLVTLGNGKTVWEDIITQYTEIIINAVDSWLNDHPEATTTVLDGSITLAKLNNKTVNELRGLNYDYNPVLFPNVEIWKNIPVGYAFPQGFCIVNDYIYMGYSSPDNAAAGIIQRFKNGVYTNLADNLYHMNSMCSDGSFIYSLDCLVGSPASALNTISVIDIASFALTDSITLNYSGDSTLAGLMYCDGLYCMDAAGKVYSVDSEYNLTLYCTLQNLTGTTQQCCMTDDFIYVSSTYPNAIFIYKHDGTLYNVINIGNIINNICPITEIEGVYIYNNCIYVRASTTTNEDIIIKAYLYKTAKSIVPMYDNNFVNTLYVDGNENTQERISAHYFKTLQNAINYASQFPNAKFIIKLNINSAENIEINSENLSIRIDGAEGVTFSGTFVIRAGNVTIQGLAMDVDGTDEFIYISNSTNAPCYLNLSGTVTGVATTNFIRTYGKCDIVLNVTGNYENVITLGAYASLITNTNFVINQQLYSKVYSNGILNYVSGYLYGGVPIAVSVDITLSNAADTEITQTGRAAQQNTHVELRTTDGCKGDFFLSTANVQILPFYQVNNNIYEIYYIRLRRDAAGKLYAMLINAPTGTVKINLIIYH